jgi:hypothetical protein
MSIGLCLGRRGRLSVPVFMLCSRPDIIEWLHSRSNAVVLMSPPRKVSAQRARAHHMLCIGGALSRLRSVRLVRQLGLSHETRQTLHYWRRRFEDPDFHPNGRGGSRGDKFTPHQLQQIDRVIWDAVRDAPLTTFYELLHTLKTPPTSLPVLDSWLRKRLKSMNLGWKKPVVQQMVKWLLVPLSLYIVDNFFSCFVPVVFIDMFSIVSIAI